MAIKVSGTTVIDDSRNLSNVNVNSVPIENYLNPNDIASQAEAEARTDNTKLMTPLRVAQAIESYTDIIDVTPSGTTYTIDLSLGNHFSLGQLGADLSESFTIALSNIPSGESFSFLIEMDYGLSPTLTWPSNFVWLKPSDTAPTLTTASKEYFEARKQRDSDYFYVVRVGPFENMDGFTFPIFADSTSSTGTGSNLSVNLTNITDLREDDFVLVFAGVGHGSNTTISTSSTGWTSIGGVSVNHNNSVSANIFYKFMGATPDTSFTMIPNRSSNCLGIIAFVFRNVNQANPLDVTPTTTAFEGSAVPQPPDITPTSSPVMYICAGASGHRSGAAFFSTTDPDIDNFISFGVNSTEVDLSIGMGNGIIGSGLKDGSNFSFNGGFNDQYSNLAYSLVLRGV